MHLRGQMIQQERERPVDRIDFDHMEIVKYHNNGRVEGCEFIEKRG